MSDTSETAIRLGLFKLVVVFAAAFLAGRAASVVAQDAVQDELKSKWEFGVEITSSGEASGITAVFPVPIDWPDQSVVLGANQSTDNVAHTEFIDLGTAKMMKVYIRHMSAGETARIVVPAAITKRRLDPPADPSQLSFAPQGDKTIRTYLRPSPQIESAHHKIRELAKSTVGIDESADAWDQVETIFRWVRDNIEYHFEETNRSCLEALAQKRGDCGEMTGLFIAICRARGIPARAVWVPEHTYPEFYLVDREGNGHWIACQVAGDYQFGTMLEPKPVLQKGDNFKVPGQKKATRYAQPTLSATEATAPLSVKWILQRVDEAAPQESESH